MMLKDLHDPVAQARVGNAIASAVEISFVADGSTATQDEIKRRTNICIEHFAIMRNDFHWSITKICDLLAQSLRAELDCGNPSEFLAAMEARGWVKVERHTPGGLIVP